MMKATPRKAAMVPSVAMTALTRPIVTISPLTAPAMPPTNRPNRIPKAADPVCCTPSAMHTVERPTTAPTEMSSPPDTMTMVCAVARMPRIAMVTNSSTRVKPSSSRMTSQLPQIGLVIIVG